VDDAIGPTHGVEIYWLPLGVRGGWIRLCGMLYEALAALVARRARRDLYHSVLEVRAPSGRFVIEMGPAVDDDLSSRGVVARGVVGAAWAAVLRTFRYEIRCWRGGTSAFAYAVESRRLTDEGDVADRVLETIHDVPTPLWGRDQLRAGEMWTCNSVISWLVARTGLDSVGLVGPPAGGRAPGWHAGLVVGKRSVPQ
jgi:hypothetical protein